jgi:transposase
MKTINMVNPQGIVKAPARPPQGAHGASGGGLAGGAGDEIKAPDPEVPGHKSRRKLSAQYKLRILAEVERCSDSRQVGQLLRREGLYSSSLTRWRRLRDQGLLDAMAPKTRGRKPVEHNPLTDEVSKLQKENQRLRKKLWQAERIIEVQKKISQILDSNLDLESEK